MPELNYWPDIKPQHAQDLLRHANATLRDYGLLVEKRRFVSAALDAETRARLRAANLLDAKDRAIYVNKPPRGIWHDPPDLEY